MSYKSESDLKDGNDSLDNTITSFLEFLANDDEYKKEFKADIQEVVLTLISAKRKIKEWESS